VVELVGLTVGILIMTNIKLIKHEGSSLEMPCESCCFDEICKETAEMIYFLIGDHTCEDIYWTREILHG